MSVQDMQDDRVAEAGWYVDPLGRFQGRFFDGVAWTDQVSVDGRLATDPAWPPRTQAASDEPKVVEPVATPPDANTVEPADRRQGMDRRQVDLPGAPNRRSEERRLPELVVPGA